MSVLYYIDVDRCAFRTFFNCKIMDKKIHIYNDNIFYDCKNIVKRKLTGIC